MRVNHRRRPTGQEPLTQQWWVRVPDQRPFAILGEDEVDVRSALHPVPLNVEVFPSHAYPTCATCPAFTSCMTSRWNEWGGVPESQEKRLTSVHLCRSCGKMILAEPLDVAASVFVSDDCPRAGDGLCGSAYACSECVSAGKKEIAGLRDDEDVHPRVLERRAVQFKSITTYVEGS